jgi:hypothetical protein
MSDQPSRRGRRSISDAAALALMAQFNLMLIRTGELPNDRAAARAAAKDLKLTGASQESIEERIRLKFRRERESLMNAAENAVASNNLSNSSPISTQFLSINSQAIAAEQCYVEDTKQKDGESCGLR